MRQLPCKRGSRSVITYIYISLVRKLTVRYCSRTNSNSVSLAPFFAPRLSIRIVRPFSFHRGQTGLHFASIQLANNSVSTCQKSKKEAGKRERKERDIERKKKERIEEKLIQRKGKANNGWLCTMGGAQWVFGIRKNECAKERENSELAMRNWQWMADWEMRERTRMLACVPACKRERKQI